MTHSSYIAPHLREHIFRAYEPLLREAVDAWPRETAYDVPVGVASATFLGNFRNAVVSLSRYNWPTNVNVDKLRTLLRPRAFTIVLDDASGKLWFRAPRKLPRVTVSTTSSSSVTNLNKPESSIVPWGDWTEAELEALCLLIDKQRLVGPFFFAGRVDTKLVDHYQTLFNVALVYDEERKLTAVT